MVRKQPRRNKHGQKRRCIQRLVKSGGTSSVSAKASSRSATGSFKPTTPGYRTGMSGRGPDPSNRTAGHPAHPLGKAPPIGDTRLQLDRTGSARRYCTQFLPHPPAGLLKKTPSAPHCAGVPCAPPENDRRETWRHVFQGTGRHVQEPLEAGAGLDGIFVGRRAR